MRPSWIRRLQQQQDGGHKERTADTKEKTTKKKQQTPAKKKPTKMEEKGRKPTNSKEPEIQKEKDGTEECSGFISELLNCWITDLSKLVIVNKLIWFTDHIRTTYRPHTDRSTCSLLPSTWAGEGVLGFGGSVLGLQLPNHDHLSSLFTVRTAIYRSPGTEFSTFAYGSSKCKQKRAKSRVTHGFFTCY